MRMHTLTPTFTSTYVDVTRAEAASAHAMHDVTQTSQCFAVDQSVPHRRQNTTTLRRSNRSAHGQQRGHVVHADHHCAALRSVRPARHHRLTLPEAL